MGDEYPTIDIRVQRARQVHLCVDNQCKSREIQGGQRYIVIKFIDREDFPDVVQTMKFHLNCLEFYDRCDFIKLLDKKGIPYIEKDNGLFKIDMEE